MDPRLLNECDPSSTCDSGLGELHVDAEDPGIADFALNVGALGNASGTPMDGVQNLSCGGESTRASRTLLCYLIAVKGGALCTQRLTDFLDAGGDENADLVPKGLQDQAQPRREQCVWNAHVGDEQLRVGHLSHGQRRVVAVQK